MNYLMIKLGINQSGVGTLSIGNDQITFNDFNEFSTSGERLGGITYDFIYQIVGGMFAVIGLRNIPQDYAGICLQVNTDVAGRVMLASTETGKYDAEPLTDTLVEVGEFARTFYSDGSQYGGFPIDQVVPDQNEAAETTELENSDEMEQGPEPVVSDETQETDTPVVEEGQGEVAPMNLMAGQDGVAVDTKESA